MPNLSNFAHRAKSTTKITKISDFYPKSTILTPPTVYGVPSARMSGPLKLSKNDDKTPPFLTQKTTKNRAFWALWTPPKIIKNRLNFAHSEKFQKSLQNRGFSRK